MKYLFMLFAFSTCGTTNQKGVIEDSITVKISNHFNIKLPAMLGTGYSWSLKDSAYQQYLSFDSTYTISESSGKEGAQEMQVFQFTGIVKGITYIQFIHSRPWKKEEEPNKERSYKVIIE